MRHCKIPVGCTREDKPCCADCGDETCEARCWNSPKRCSCWAEGPLTKRERVRKIDDLQVALLYGKDLTQSEIARQLGCARSTVYASLKRMGVGKYGGS